MVFTGISIDRKDKALFFFFFKKRTEKGTESLPNRNSITERTRSRALAGWLNALVLVGSVQASRGRAEGPEPRRDITATACKDFSVWVTHEVTMLGLRSQP